MHFSHLKIILVFLNYLTLFIVKCMNRLILTLIKNKVYIKILTFKKYN